MVIGCLMKLTVYQLKITVQLLRVTVQLLRVTVQLLRVTAVLMTKQKKKKDETKSAIITNIHETKAHIESDEPELEPRNEVALKSQPAFQKHIENWYTVMEKGILDIIKDETKAFTENQSESMLKKVKKKFVSWWLPFDKATKVIREKVMKQTHKLAGVELNKIDADNFPLSNQIDDKPFKKALNDEHFRFAKKINDTASLEIKQVFLDARKNGSSLLELEQSIKSQFKTISNYKAKMIARTETLKAANSGAVQRYKQAGITKKVWQCTGSPCPYCGVLNGKVVGIDSNYFDQDEIYEPTLSQLKEAGKTFPNMSPVPAMKMSYGQTLFPPLHPNCYCVVTAFIE